MSVAPPRCATTGSTPRSMAITSGDAAPADDPCGRCRAGTRPMQVRIGGHAGSDSGGLGRVEASHRGHRAHRIGRIGARGQVRGRPRSTATGTFSSASRSGCPRRECRSVGCRRCPWTGSTAHRSPGIRSRRRQRPRRRLRCRHRNGTYRSAADPVVRTVLYQNRPCPRPSSDPIPSQLSDIRGQGIRHVGHAERHQARTARSISCEVPGSGIAQLCLHHSEVPRRYVVHV